MLLPIDQKGLTSFGLGILQQMQLWMIPLLAKFGLMQVFHRVLQIVSVENPNFVDSNECRGFLFQWVRIVVGVNQYRVMCVLKKREKGHLCLAHRRGKHRRC